MAQLNRDLFASQDALREAQAAARKHEKDHHDTLVLLRRAQAANPATANAEAQVRIQSLETQLNAATQQLGQLRVECAPNAADGQMAVRQSEVNEQLEALHAENVAAHKALEEMTANCDITRKLHVQLRMEALREKAKQDAASSALEVRCLQAEAEVVELKEKISTLERRGSYHVSPTTAAATLGSNSQPACGGKGSGLVAQFSPQPGRKMGGLTTQASPSLGRGMSGLGARQVLAPPSMRRGFLGCIARSGTGSGFSMLAPGQRLGVPAANAGQAQGSGGAMDIEGAGHAPGASTVTTGASSTTTNQDSARAGSHLPPKSEVTRLAGRGAALGHGTQTANLPQGVRFPNDSPWGEARTGEIQRSRVQCCS